MAQNPFKMLFQSRKFWLAVVDALAAILGLWVGAYADPKLATLIMATWAAIQPVFVVIILMIGYEDKARLEAATTEMVERGYAADRQKKDLDKAAAELTEAYEAGKADALACK